MKVEINIQKKDLFLLSAIVVFLVGVGVVMSYNAAGTGGTPSIMGHSVDEIAGVQKQITGTCTGQVMVGINPTTGVVICESDDDTNTHGKLVCRKVSKITQCTTDEQETGEYESGGIASFGNRWCCRVKLPGEG